MLADMFPRPAVIAAFACIAAAGCAGPQSTQTTTNPIPAPSRTQLTGTVLASALLPLSDFPAGYEIDTQDTSDSGPTLLPGSPSPASSLHNCQQMVHDVLLSAAGTTAFAADVLYDTSIDHPSSYHQRRYVQNVYQFAAASGSTGYFDQVRSVFSRCTSQTTIHGTTKSVIKQTVRAASPVAGHQTVLVRQTGTVNGVNVDAVLLVTIVRTDVYKVGATVFGVPLTAQPSSLAALTAKLIGRVHAYECALACASLGEEG